MDSNKDSCRIFLFRRTLFNFKPCKKNSKTEEFSSFGTVCAHYNATEKFVFCYWIRVVGSKFCINWDLHFFNGNGKKTFYASLSHKNVVQVDINEFSFCINLLNRITSNCLICGIFSTPSKVHQMLGSEHITFGHWWLIVFWYSWNIYQVNWERTERKILMFRWFMLCQDLWDVKSIDDESLNCNYQLFQLLSHWFLPIDILK